MSEQKPISRRRQKVMGFLAAFIGIFFIVLGVVKILEHREKIQNLQYTHAKVLAKKGVWKSRFGITVKYRLQIEFRPTANENLLITKNIITQNFWNSASSTLPIYYNPQEPEDSNQWLVGNETEFWTNDKPMIVALGLFFLSIGLLYCFPKTTKTSEHNLPDIQQRLNSNETISIQQESRFGPYAKYSLLLFFAAIFLFFMNAVASFVHASYAFPGILVFAYFLFKKFNLNFNRHFEFDLHKCYVRDGSIETKFSWSQIFKIEYDQSPTSGPLKGIGSRPIAKIYFHDQHGKSNCAIIALVRLNLDIEQFKQILSFIPDSVNEFGNKQSKN